MEAVQKLGAEVEKLWREKNYSEELFPVIAEKALQEFELPHKISAWDAAVWTMGEDYLPEQRDLPGRFGDPPITLYNSPRFHIDIYFWLNGTTSVHQHGFCGAFQVLLGSSIHSDYKFELQESINHFTQLGNIELEDCELLKIGDVRQIRAGRDFIHSLFHLDQPSATVVVRTHRSALHLPQFDYRKPFLAIDPFFEDPTTRKKLQTVSMLLQAKYPEAERVLADWLKSADFQTTFTILSETRHLLQNNPLEQLFQVGEVEDRYDKLFEIVRRRHGTLADAIQQVFDKQQQINQLVSRRAFITNPEHRFFLALLLNVESKSRIFSLVKKRFPESEPLDKILEWVSELAETRILGSNLPNALGLEDFSDFDLILLEDLLGGLSQEEMQANFPAAAQNQGSAAADPGNISNRLGKIRESIILKPLLNGRFRDTKHQ